MDKNTVLSLAPHVLKRMEYALDTFYLLNFENDEIWTGNYSSYLIIDKLNGKDNIDTIIKNLIKEYSEFSYEELYNSAIIVFKELSDKKFILSDNSK
ncbi:PqqD family protein [bacterium]|nr:PqqD family protein [bacterium]